MRGNEDLESARHRMEAATDAAEGRRVAQAPKPLYQKDSACGAESANTITCINIFNWWKKEKDD